MPPDRVAPEGRALSGQLAWVASILMGEEPPATGPSVVRGGGEGLVVVPSANRPRLLLPSTRRAAVASLRNHSALRSPSVHTARTALAAALGLGLPQAVFRDRLVFGSGGERVSPPLVEHLRSVLGVPALDVAVAVGPPAPNRKPALQLLTPSGDAVGFAKVGWNGFTRDLVANEASTMASLPLDGLRTVSTPRVLHHGSWRGLELFVTSALPLGARRFHGSAPPIRAAAELAAAHGTSVGGFATSSYWTELRAERASGDRVAEDLGPALDGIERRFGTMELTYGAWHGDWAPWNLAVEGGRLWVIDWEHARRGVPVGLDAVHFRFQVEFLRRKRTLPESAERTARAAGRTSAGWASLRTPSTCCRSCISSRSGSGPRRRAASARESTRVSIRP